MRLISLPLSTRGKPVYVAAAEIKLKPDAITYWRQPGEAGVPPQFSFQGSENVARADFLFPAPQRLDEDGLEAFGYRGGVTFPIRVTPADPSKPARLNLTLDYAVCERICIPVKGHAELLLPKSGISPSSAAILAGEAAVPEALPASALAKNVVIRQETGQPKPHWQFIWHGKQPITDLFAEGPDGWVFTTHKTGGNTYSIAALETPATPPATVSVKLTLSGPEPYEFTVPLGILPGPH
jgi:DsbC/DsbD-like thiol-disulfide interchange protein